MIRRVLALAFLLALGSLTALAATGCDGKQSASPPTTQTTAPADFALPAATVRFARMAAEPLARGGLPYAGPATPHSLGGVTIAGEVRRALAAQGVSEALARQGFAVVPADFRLFHMAYQGNVYEGWPVFVTTDVAYHQWHLVFDKLLRSLEQKALLPKLERLVAGLLEASHAQTAEVAGTPLEDTASRVEQLFQVAAAELGLPVTLGPLAVREKALVDAHSAPDETSPLVGGKLDYSLFTPRGHYTRTPELERYFTAMSVLGQSAFCLPGTVGCPGLEPARRAILASRVLVARPELVALWRDLYEPTAFLVGMADDYTPLDVAAAAVAVAAAALEEPGAFADDAVVQDVVEALTDARPVLISPDRASIRMLGTRFVVDSFILDQLLYPYVGTREKQRLVPSALDLAAAFGSDFAYRVQEQQGQTAYANYDTQLAALREAIAARPVADWGSTVYDAWLHALEPSFVARGQAFPDFMRTDAWTAKAHQSGFGSYAELKHDTILYTKQAMAEGGDSAEIPARRNWVEPDPVAFARLAAAAELMRQGLSDRSLLEPEQAGLLRDEISLFRFLERIARDELAGAPISVADNERLTYLGGELEARFVQTSELTETGVLADQDAAIVADIASSPQGILEVGTGRIDRIYVLVPDDGGRFQVAVGGVYSFYEFTNPPGERLTDEAWRAKLEAGGAPGRPAWEEAFLAG